MGKEGGRGIGMWCCATGPGYDYVWPFPFPYKKEDGTQLQMKDIPLNCARKLGLYTRTWNTFPIYYIITMFVIVPGILFGISSLFDGTTAEAVLGVMIIIGLVTLMLRVLYYLYRQDGFATVQATIEKRQKSLLFRRNLEQTVADLQAEVAALKGIKGSELLNISLGEYIFLFGYTFCCVLLYR